MILLQEAQFIHNTEENVVRLCPTVRNFTGENPIAPPVIQANLKDMFDNWSVCENKTVRDFAYLLCDGTKKVNEAYAANGMSTDNHVYYGTSPVVNNALS